LIGTGEFGAIWGEESAQNAVADEESAPGARKRDYLDVGYNSL
jgi:hypothetical protein